MLQSIIMLILLLLYQASEGENLLDVAINNDVDIDGYGACEGTLACSTCHLIFTPEVGYTVHTHTYSTVHTHTVHTHIQWSTDTHTYSTVLTHTVHYKHIAHTEQYTHRQYSTIVNCSL